MKFAYEDLGDDQFEDLIVLLCQRLLGMGVQGFARGPDGGRDARFTGTAELLPSKAAPWNGTVIVQAKHTNGYNRSFSEADFFNAKSDGTILGKEIPRIKKLRAAKQLDHYMLFSNRRLTGNAESAIRSHIAKVCDVPEVSVMLCGLESLETWLKTFGDVPALAKLDPIDSPLIVSPDELAEVVEGLGKHMNGAVAEINDPPTPRVPYEVKNKINGMTEDYAKALRRRYLKETGQIQKFLADPVNLGLLGLYDTVVEEFQLKIIAKRQDYQSFDQVMEYLLDLLFNRDAVLRANKRLTRAVLFFMYWNCDIGEGSDAVTTH